MNSRSRIFRILLAVAIISAIGITVVETAAATNTFNAYNPNGFRWVTIDGDEHAVVSYTIPHGTLQFPLKGSDYCAYPCYRPYVGGVDYYIAANMLDHTDPQKWDYYKRSQINTYWDKLELLIPRRYVYIERTFNPCWSCDIYLTVYWR